MDKKKTKFKLKSVRYFSEDFKKQKVNEIITRKITIREVSAIYDIAPKVLYDWLHKFSPEHQKQTKIVVEMQTEAEKTMFYKERVAELERLVGQKQIEIEFLTKMIELASEELQVDLKKNYSTKLLNGSGNTSKKSLLP
jgi:transposase-like protein